MSILRAGNGRRYTLALDLLDDNSRKAVAAWQEEKARSLRPEPTPQSSSSGTPTFDKTTWNSSVAKVECKGKWQAQIEYKLPKAWYDVTVEAGATTLRRMSPDDTVLETVHLLPPSDQAPWEHLEPITMANSKLNANMKEFPGDDRKTFPLLVRKTKMEGKEFQEWYLQTSVREPTFTYWVSNDTIRLTIVLTVNAAGGADLLTPDLIRSMIEDMTVIKQ